SSSHFPVQRPPPTHLYTLSLHDALPILAARLAGAGGAGGGLGALHLQPKVAVHEPPGGAGGSKHRDGRQRRADRGAAERAGRGGDRKSTRLNSSHVKISYADFCLKKKIR